MVHDLIETENNATPVSPSTADQEVQCTTRFGLGGAVLSSSYRTIQNWILVQDILLDSFLISMTIYGFQVRRIFHESSIPQIEFY